MALVKCPECGRKISDKAASCPNCGYPISQKIESSSETLPPSKNAATHHAPTSDAANITEQNEGRCIAQALEQLSPPQKKKLKTWQKILICVGSFVAIIAVLFVIFVVIPSIKCVNAYESISPYLDYVGSLDEDETIDLGQEEYDNVDNVVFLGMRGKISFNGKDGYISSCTWTSFDYYSEEKYQTIADGLLGLYMYFNAFPEVEQESYSNGNTYRYYWTDPYYGFAVTVAHGISSYDSEGVIEIKWEACKDSCEIIGHTWADATCTDPETCLVCGETKGSAAGHQGIEASEWDIDYNEAANIQKYRCTVCEEVVELQSEPITTFISGDRFTIHSSAFADRFEASSSRLNNIDYYTKCEYNEYGYFDEDNTVFYRIQDRNDDYDDIGLMSFNKPGGKTVAVMDKYTETCIGCINILIEDSRDVSAIVYSAILAIDPGIGYSEAADIGQEVVDSIATTAGDIDEEDFQGTNYNGINYLLYKDREYHYLIITLADE